MEERWKDVKGYEDYYSISNTGKLLSKRRERLMKTHIDIGGYERVELNKNGKGKKYFIHRLVAEAFIMKDESRPFVNHIDFDTTNNNVNNLEWCTQKENIRHSAENGRMCTKEANKATSKKVYQYTLDGELVNTFNSTMDVERELGLSNGHISLCCREPQRTSGGFHWRYEPWR